MLACACVGLGAALLAWRGAWPAFEYGKDWALVYAEARGWLAGVSPYDAAGLDPVWDRAGGDPEWPPSRRGNLDLLYPPSAFVVLAPLAALPWAAAKIAWIVLNVALAGVIAWGVVVLAGVRWREPLAWFIVAACLAFAPIHTSLKHGQTAVFVVALVVAGEAVRVLGKPALAGVLLGLGACVKPQIGLPLLALEAWRRRWGVLLPGVATMGVVAAVAAARLWGIHWPAQLRSNVAEFTASGAGEAGPANLIRYQMINLHPLIHDVVGGGAAMMLAVWCVVGVLGCLYMLVIRSPREHPRDVLAAGFVSVLGLMLVYHRSYDAAILLLGLAWAVGAWRSGNERARPPALVVVAAIALFLFPLAAILATLAERGAVPERIGATWAWRAMVMGHQSWALLALACAMVWARARAGDVGPGASPGAT